MLRCCHIFALCCVSGVGDDDSDVEDDVCVCLVLRRSEHGGSMVLDDTSTLTQCRALRIGWSPIDRRFLDTESTCRDMIKILKGSSVDKLELIIQSHSGWATVRYIEIEEGQCPLHYKDNIGWVWVSVKLQGESSRWTFLCNLHRKLYGVDEGYSWCLLKSVSLWIHDNLQLRIHSPKSSQLRSGRCAGHHTEKKTVTVNQKMLLETLFWTCASCMQNVVSL